MRVLITGASGGIGAACVQRFLDEGHEVVGFDLLPTAVEHERYRHLIVDVREPNSFPGDLEPQVIVNVAGVQDSADDIAANLRGTINVTERYAFVGEGLAAKPAPAIQSVVNVGSASGHTGSEFPAYAASKEPPDADDDDLGVVTTIAEVNGETRVHEIARMLSGSESEASLDHARELLSDSRLTLPLAGAGAAGD